MIWFAHLFCPALPVLALILSEIRKDTLFILKEDCVASVSYTHLDVYKRQEVFYQSFVESYETTHMHVTGKLHFDSKRDMEKIDRTDGQYETLCGSVLPKFATPCSHLVRDKKRYIVYP